MHTQTVKTMLPDWTTWDLTLADDVLSYYEKYNHRLHLEYELARLWSEATIKSKSPESMLSIYDDIMKIDRILFSIQSAFNLYTLCQSEKGTHTELYRWHLDQTAHFGQLIEEYIRCIEVEVNTLPTTIHTWLNSMTASCLSPELQQFYANIASQYETDRLKACSALAHRSRIDPGVTAFTHRMRDNRLHNDQVNFTAVHQAESQAYFARLQIDSGIQRPLLSDIRDLEDSQFAHLHFSLSDTLRLLRASFSQCHPECAREIDRILTQGRLRLLPEADLPDLCLDTPFGSYVQLDFDGSLSSAVRLAHEIGHAVHHYLHRHSAHTSEPLNAVDSETWALDFETVFLESLEIEYPDCKTNLIAFRQSRQIEMNHRQRMLHHFEHALHGNDIRSIEDIDALWLNTNQLFYGNSIDFDTGFKRRWTQVHHLFTAPFYLMIYGIAKDRADATRPTHCINQHYPQRKE